MIDRRELLLTVIICFAALCLSGAPAEADIAGLTYHVQGGSTTLTGSPDYDWWYGCSPTSAGMMMGYYDRNGYASLYYDNLVPGGVAELSSFGNPGAIANQAIASRGHQWDFYGNVNGSSNRSTFVYDTGGRTAANGYGYSGDDVATPHHSFDSLADFMGTSQDLVGTSNGATRFYYWDDGSKFHDYDAVSEGLWNKDGMYGIGEYVSYAGYAHGADNLYTQVTDNQGLTYGFTYNDYMTEIDAGRVVMLHVEGHSMFGYGYDDTGEVDIVYLNDTWTAAEHTMTWGETYPYGKTTLDMWGVTVFEPTGGVVPVPAAVILGILGLGVVGIKLRKFA